MKKAIALTFDDGPEATTADILKALAENGAVATFFVNGNCLEKYPELTKRAFELGCEIGNHTYAHFDLTRLSYQGIKTEIAKTTVLLEQITRTKPRLMRPPYGYYNSAVLQAAKDSNLTLINWNIDPKDWDTDDKVITRQRILAEIADGAIILCHDRLQSTADLMASFITELQAADYQLLTVSQLFEYQGIIPVAGRLYTSPEKSFAYE